MSYAHGRLQADTPAILGLENDQKMPSGRDSFIALISKVTPQNSLKSSSLYWTRGKVGLEKTVSVFSQESMKCLQF